MLVPPLDRVLHRLVGFGFEVQVELVISLPFPRTSTTIKITCGDSVERIGRLCRTQGRSDVSDLYETCLTF